MACILDGVAVASALNERTAAAVATLRTHGIHPTLAIVRTSNRADHLSYERSAVAQCQRVGVKVRLVTFPADVKQEVLDAAMIDLSMDNRVHGVLVLLPLPDHLDSQSVKAALDPAKDVDGITGASFAGVYAGYGEGWSPCAAAACMEMLDYYDISCEGKRAVVIGQGLVAGRPIALMLLAANATPTLCHVKSIDVPSISREADIVVVATGRTNTVGARYFRSGQVVLDVGIGWDEAGQRMCGDVIFDEVEPLVGFLSPVPQGVGAVTVSVLASHVALAAQKAGR